MMMMMVVVMMMCADKWIPHTRRWNARHASGKLCAIVGDRNFKQALLEWHYLSIAPCLMPYGLVCFVLFIVSRITINHSPFLKKTCVRQVVLDKRFPLTLRATSAGGSAPGRCQKAARASKASLSVPDLSKLGKRRYMYRMCTQTWLK